MSLNFAKKIFDEKLFSQFSKKRRSKLCFDFISNHSLNVSHIEMSGMRMKIFNNVANFKWSNNRSDMLNIMVLLITGTYHFPHSLAVNIKL